MRQTEINIENQTNKLYTEKRADKIIKRKFTNILYWYEPKYKQSYNRDWLTKWQTENTLEREREKERDGVPLTDSWSIKDKAD